MSKLFKKALLVMILLFGVIAVSVSALAGYILYDKLVEEYTEKAVAITNAIASSSLEIFLNRDEAVIQSVIDQYIETRDVAYVLVAYEDGEIISHTFVPKVPDEILALVGATRQDTDRDVVRDIDIAGQGHYLDVCSPILSGVAGYVHVGMSLKSIRSYIWATIGKLQLTTLAVFLLAVAAAYLLMNSISKPLKALAAYADKVAAGDYGAAVEVDAEDEVGLLASTMSNMASEIKAQITGLEKVNASLKQEIAERERAEMELKAAEEKYREIFEYAVEGIYQSTPEGRYLSANPAMARILGYDGPEELVSEITDIASQLYVDKEERARLQAEIMAKGFVEDFKARFRRKDGSAIWVSQSARAVRDPGGRVLYFEGLLDDITKRMEAEEALRSAKDKAEEATRAKSEFLANMSHEIRTPLNAVMGLAVLAAKRPLDPVQADYLRKISDSSHTLKRIIDDILDFSKIEAGKLVLEHIPFSLPDVTRRMRDMFADKASEKGVALLIDVGKDVPESLTGDPFRLGQVLMNLMNNALKFTDQGQVALRVSLERRRGDAVDLAFVVSDTGIGIPEDKVGLLFDSFTQADGSTTRKYGGTGLGLTISKRLAEMMGGGISVSSAPGKGSSFILRISLETGPKERSERAPAETRPNDCLTGARILVAEDNSINRQVAKEMLEKAGAVVETVENGRQAVDMMTARNFDAVLMDIQMPVMDGYEATMEALAANPDAPPIIAMTAHALKADRDKCLEAGMAGHLAKPIEPEELYALLARHLGPAKARKPGQEEPARADTAESRLPEDLPGIEVRNGLGRLAGNKGLYRSILGEFARDFSTASVEIRNLLDKGNETEAKHRIHTLKGVAANISAPGLARAAEKLEDALAEGEEVADRLGSLEWALNEVLESIESLPGRADPLQSCPVRSRPRDRRAVARDALDMMERLARKVADNDPEAEDCLKELRRLAPDGPLAGQLDLLEDQIGRFDFPSARSTMQSLSEKLKKNTG